MGLPLTPPPRPAPLAIKEAPDSIRGSKDLGASVTRKAFCKHEYLCIEACTTMSLGTKTGAQIQVQDAIQGSGSIQDLLTPDPVGARFDRRPAHQIHLPAQNLGELPLHPGMVKKAPVRVGREAHQKVNVAVGAEVLSQSRSEEGELDELPPMAEFFDAVSGPVERQGYEEAHILFTETLKCGADGRI